MSPELAFRSPPSDVDPKKPRGVAGEVERDFFIDNLLVRIHFIILMIRWAGLAPWEFEFPVPGSLTSTFLAGECRKEQLFASIRRLWEASRNTPSSQQPALRVRENDLPTKLRFVRLPCPVSSQGLGFPSNGFRV